MQCTIPLLLLVSAGGKQHADAILSCVAMRKILRITRPNKSNRRTTAVLSASGIIIVFAVRGP